MWPSHSSGGGPPFQQTQLSPPVHGPEEVQIERRGDTYRVPVRINDTITVSLGHRRYGSGNINRCRAHADPSRRAEKRRLHQQEPLSAGQVGEHVVGNVTASISHSRANPCSARASFRSSALLP